LFASAGCAGCHTFEPAGSDSQIGPPLDDLAAAAQKAGKPVEEFVRESITDPSAYLAPGYQAGVMPETYSQSLTDEQVDALVQYLTQGAQG
jgi:mono/diheme cytochrome c family protein